MPKNADRIMGGPQPRTYCPASLTLAQRLTPGIGLRMGMERSRTPTPALQATVYLQPDGATVYVQPDGLTAYVRP